MKNASRYRLVLLRPFQIGVFPIAESLLLGGCFLLAGLAW